MKLTFSNRTATSRLMCHLTMVACILWLLLLRTVASKPHPSNMHTVFLADCSTYFQWQSFGMFYSYKKSGQPGPITRVVCCTEEHLANFPKV